MALLLWLFFKTRSNAKTGNPFFCIQLLNYFLYFYFSSAHLLEGKIWSTYCVSDVLLCSLHKLGDSVFSNTLEVGSLSS